MKPAQTADEVANTKQVEALDESVAQSINQLRFNEDLRALNEWSFDARHAIGYLINFFNAYGFDKKTQTAVIEIIGRRREAFSRNSYCVTVRDYLKAIIEHIPNEDDFWETATKGCFKKEKIKVRRSLSVVEKYSHEYANANRKDFLRQIDSFLKECGVSLRAY